MTNLDWTATDRRSSPSTAALGWWCRRAEREGLEDPSLAKGLDQMLDVELRINARLLATLNKADFSANGAQAHRSVAEVLAADVLAHACFHPVARRRYESISFPEDGPHSVPLAQVLADLLADIIALSRIAPLCDPADQDWAKVPFPARLASIHERCVAVRELLPG